MTVLITGSQGLVGSAVLRLLAKEPNVLSPTSQELNLLDAEGTKAYFQKHRPRLVYHCAAKVGGIGAQVRQPASMHRDNIMMNLNVLEASRLSGTEKVLGYLSTCVFPDQAKYPLKEESLHLGPPHLSNFGYAFAKRMLEVQSRAYKMEYGLKVILGVPTNVFGLHDNFSLEDGHVLPALIHRAFLAKQNQQDLVVWGSGRPLREFVFADDIARLSHWAMQHYDQDEPLNFSHGQEYSIKDTVDLVTKLIEFKGRIAFDASRPDGQMRKPSDTTKLRKLLPDFQFTPLPEALRKTIDWFVAQYPRVRK